VQNDFGLETQPRRRFLHDHFFDLAQEEDNAKWLRPARPDGFPVTYQPNNGGSRARST
jgi:hypothetical protein